MSQGQSDSKLTNKTEFMRYVDANPDEIESLAPSLRRYRFINPNGNTFGFWLRQKTLPTFIAAYRGYWLKHPELYGRVYQQTVLSV